MEQKRLLKLAACMRRAMNGEELTIGFLGGSITQGSLASSDESTYAYQVYQWWCNQFPNAKFYYVNGGIGGTTSHFGVARAEEDVLMYLPDVVVIDFSVNDDPKPFFQETYEGVLRKIMKWQTNPAVLLLNNVFYDTGVTAQDYHNELAAYYNIPYASIRDSVYQEIQKGVYTRDEVTPDGLHPNDKGHGLVANELIKVLEEAKVLAESEKDIEMNETIADPLTENAYEMAKRLNIRSCKPMLSGFRADTEEKKGHLDLFKNGWIGKKVGDKITLEVDASCIAVQYRKTIHKPSPVAKVVLDGDEEHAVILDGNFDEDWGDCLFLQPILHHGKNKQHTIEITIIESHENDLTPFYLVSFICA